MNETPAVSASDRGGRLVRLVSLVEDQRERAGRLEQRQQTTSASASARLLKRGGARTLAPESSALATNPRAPHSAIRFP